MAYRIGICFPVRFTSCSTPSCLRKLSSKLWKFRAFCKTYVCLVVSFETHVVMSDAIVFV